MKISFISLVYIAALEKILPDPYENQNMMNMATILVFFTFYYILKTNVDE